MFQEGYKLEVKINAQQAVLRFLLAVCDKFHNFIPQIADAGFSCYMAFLV